MFNSCLLFIGLGSSGFLPAMRGCCSGAEGGCSAGASLEEQPWGSHRGRNAIGHWVTSLQADEGLSEGKRGKFCSQIAWLVLVEQPQLAAHPPDIESRVFQWYRHQASPSRRPTQQDGEEGGRVSLSLSPPAPRCPAEVGWSKLCWGEALPRDRGPAQPRREQSAAQRCVKLGDH